MVFPILSAAGFNEYVVCVIIVVTCEIGGLTPPIGMTVFATASVLRIDPGRIFKGVVPFFIVDIAMVVLLAFFPQITTWLPAMMR
jgi:TRAP-type C4-dicarboxylate transport system permease large subunit